MNFTNTELKIQNTLTGLQDIHGVSFVPSPIGGFTHSVWPNSIWGSKKPSMNMIAILLTSAGLTFKRVESCFLVK